MGLFELLLIILIIMILLRPKRIPEIGTGFGRLVSYLKKGIGRGKR